MKKGFPIFFVSLYLFLTVGVNILIHTCGGKATVVVATTSVQDPCRNCEGADVDEMCCSTVVKTLQINDEQLAVAPEIVNPLVIVDLLPIETISFQLLDSPIERGHYYTDTPPPSYQELNIVNSVFLI